MMDVDLKALGNALKVRRVQVGYATATSLLRATGLNKDVLSRIESGQTSTKPHPRNIEILETALRLRPGTLEACFVDGAALQPLEGPLTRDSALPTPRNFLEAMPATRRLLDDPALDPRRREQLTELFAMIYRAGYQDGSLDKEMSDLAGGLLAPAAEAPPVPSQVASGRRE